MGVAGRKQTTWPGSGGRAPGEGPSCRTPEKQIPITDRPGIRSGDSIYLIGTAERNPEAPAAADEIARLVIRPRSEPPRPTPLSLILFFTDRDRIAKGRDYRYTFLLADSDEVQTRRLLLRSLWSILPGAVIWVGSLAYMLIVLFKHLVSGR